MVENCPQQSHPTQTPEKKLLYYSSHTGYEERKISRPLGVKTKSGCKITEDTVANCKACQLSNTIPSSWNRPRGKKPGAY